MTIMTPLTGGQDQSLIKGRAVWVPQVPWNGSGAKSFADHGRWKVDDLRAGSIRGFITYCEQKKIVWKRLPSELIPQTPRFCRLFVCQLLRCFCYLKKLETPMIWALLWLQGLQVLPVSGPTFGQSCGLQSTHYLLPDFGSPLKVSKTWLKSDRPW